MNRQMHGLSKTPLYKIWCNIKTRCLNKGDRGGRPKKVA